MSEYILKVTGVKKNFSGVQALKGVDLEIKKGGIHCLAGENGSGKSTLIKIVSGVFTMDSGLIEFSGKQYTKITPIEAIKNGIQVIYQDFSVFPNLTVLENIAFNSELADGRKLVNRKRFKQIAKEAISKINFDIDLNVNVDELSVANKQLVAISRALINNANLIILDEPTTALTKKEVASLFDIIKKLQQQGIATLFVSHKLDEVFEISERFSIIRNGENVATGNTSDLDQQKFTYYMTGRKLDNKHFQPKNINEKPILKVKDLTLKNGFTGISFSLRRGEILGITGLLGSGRTELALALFGVLKPDSGNIFINDKKVRLHNVGDAIRNRIGYVPEDRLTEGLFLKQSIGRNLVVSNIDKLANKVGIVDKTLLKQEIDKLISKLAIATDDPSKQVRTLSGGNQQRVVLAKWLATDLDILILNGPTVGVDIGSKYDIHEILHNLADKGLGIIIISDDLPEVITNCNRLLIMKGGKIHAELNPDLISEHELADQVGGGSFC